MIAGAQTAAHGELAKAPVPRRVRLGSRAYLWLACGILPAFLAPSPEAIWGTLAIDAVVLLLFAFDALRLRRVQLRVERSVAGRLRMGNVENATLALENPGTLVLRLWLRDELPTNMRSGTDVMRCVLRPHAREQLVLPLHLVARGRARFGHVALRLESRLGLAAVYTAAAEPQEVRVLPALSIEARLHQSRRNELGGVAQKLRRSPQGSELESLREYVSQDPLRAIDWKATARRHRPVTRLYQPERSQTLWLVLDASRSMTGVIGSSQASAAPTPRASVVPAGSEQPGELHKTRFDVAIETALALADAALYAGDQVGLMVYADGSLSLASPGRGRRHYLRLVDMLTDLEARPVHFAVRSLLADLEHHARKRALIVLFTDLENETHGAALCEHAPLLTRRHLAVCVSLHDALTKQRAGLAPAADGEVFHKAAAIELVEDRENLQRRLEKRGVTVLEADARGLAQKVLDHYLRVKLSSRL